MILVAFKLTMPSCGSWNGKWSGNESLYARVRSFTAEQVKQLNIADKLDKDFNYRWDDGWCANVEVNKINAKQAKDIRKNSKGFYGYDWMIKSIIENGDIRLEEKI